MSLNTGFHLARRYRLLRRIAVGGMGEVWEAEDSRLGRRVAIKVLKPELTGDPEFRQRFHTEAQLTASLNHPGIAGVYDYGEAPGSAAPPGHHQEADTAYLVMELVDGDSLATILGREHRLSADRTLDILGQAGAALNAAHQRGLVHRDVKPGNILITPAGQVKLTDFGIAKAVDAAPVTRQGMVMGTAHYIAPEQAAGAEAGPASDIYSLGVVGYECLAGERPFHSDNPLTVAMMHVNDPPPPLPGDVPPAVRTLIEATLVKDPWQRYRSGGDFGAAVDTVRLGRTPPLPAGMEGTTATVAAPTATLNEPPGEQYPPQTALLPPGSHDTGYGSGYSTGYGPPAAPPPGTGRYPDDYPDEPAAKRRSSARTAIVVALLGVLGLILGTYGIREALRPGTAAPSTSSAAPVQPPPPAATEPPPEAPPTTQPPAAEVPPPPTQDDTQGDSERQDSAPTEDKPDTVFVVPTDYLGKSGKSAAATAKEKDLKPRVVDEQGNKLDSDQQSECEVSDIDPAAGFVPRGSTLELTCGGA